MIELGELEKEHKRFDDRKVRVMIVSNDDLETARATQSDFPHLVVVSDLDQNLAKAMEVLHAGVGPGGTDTNAPTTFLVTGAGEVSWFWRPERFVERLTPTQLAAAIDQWL